MNWGDWCSAGKGGWRRLAAEHRTPALLEESCLGVAWNLAMGRTLRWPLGQVLSPKPLACWGEKNPLPIPQAQSFLFSEGSSGSHKSSRGSPKPSFQLSRKRSQAPYTSLGLRAFPAHPKEDDNPFQYRIGMVPFSQLRLKVRGSRRACEVVVTQRRSPRYPRSLAF
jgi:hypothetical protein